MKIVCLGDSLTEGDYGVFGKSGIANVKEKGYPYFLQKLTGVEVLNYGKCGYTSTTYLKHYTEGLADVNGADIVLIMLGSNGGLDFKKNTQGNDDYRKLVSLVKKDAPDAKVVLITPPHVTQNPEYSNCGYISRIISSVPFVKSLASETSCQLIDANGYKEFNEETEKLYQANDGLHFVEEGYKLLATLIFEDLKKIYPEMF